VNGSFDLGSGSDTLRLGNQTNRLSASNIETVIGGSGSDTIVLTGSMAASIVGGANMNFITGNSGANQFVLDLTSGDYSSVLNFSAAKGDKIALDTAGSSTFSGNAYDLGGASLTDNTNIKSVADATARLGVTEATGGKGGFVYQQDTGELYYSNNGAFGGGGTLIGVIESANGVPWTYSASSFIQV
jgi:hypothetical protein